tara:strand:- start:587 stop:1837 length:1251 start_codon:yes stop_codon:yes gene_type:complete
MAHALTMPTGGIVDLKWMPQTAVAKTESPFSFASQVHKHPGQRRQVKVRLAPMEASTAREWIAFFLKLNGPEGVFFLSDTVGQNPTASRGTPVVSAASQTGKSITYTGAAASSTIVSAGEWLEIGGRLHQATDTSTSDGSGDGTFKVWPEVQTAPPNGAPIEVDSPKGTFRLIELPSYTWSVNRLMQGVSFTAVEVVAQEVLDFVGVEAALALSTTRNLYGSFSGPRFKTTEKIYDQSGNERDAFPDPALGAVTLESDNSWSFPTTGTKAVIKLGDFIGSTLPDNQTCLAVMDANSVTNQYTWGRGSTGGDWFGASSSGSTSSNVSSSISVGDLRVNGTVVGSTRGDLYTALGGNKVVFSAESVEFSAMDGTFKWGVNSGVYGFKGLLYEIIVLPDLSSTLRDALIDNMKAAHGIS